MIFYTNYLLSIGTQFVSWFTGVLYFVLYFTPLILITYIADDYSAVPALLFSYTGIQLRILGSLSAGDYKS
jgi:hypothetical protein